MTQVDPLHSHKSPTSAAAKAAIALVATLLALPLWWLLIALLQTWGALSRPLQPPDDTRLALWLGVSLLLLCWAPARRLGTGLVARFDGVLLRPPASLDLVSLTTESSDACQQLRDWCFNGVGTGAAPLLLPNAIPPMAQPLSIAVWDRAPPPQQAAQQNQLNAFMGQLDGTGLLLTCSGPWARLGLRLRIKLREACWWRARKASDPWDCGFLQTNDTVVARLRAFSPRRATLIVVQDASTQTLRDSIATLQQQQERFSHPVRLLLIAAPELEDIGPVVRIH